MEAMEPAKAIIEVQRSSEPKTIKVLFNPNEYNLQAGNTYSWKTIPGLQSPIAQFISGEAATLTMDLFFDTYERLPDDRDSDNYDTRDVRRFTDQITGLTKVDNDLHAPPICRFLWGPLDFSGVVEKVSQRFTMFLDTGIPVRATLNVTFRKVLGMTEQYQETPRQSADRTKQKTLKQGEHLWMIAAEEYEDPGMWRPIAEANGIDNPRRLATGRKLIIPRLD
ncbi:peptidoglycan-binding protein [Paenibacillaceae bacterium WGS1546]|uniref:CIS tube protein n=1 Tax=Cohnella sp. WGS1546 TaxID=3366810 RepID=UPI00372D797D